MASYTNILAPAPTEKGVWVRALNPQLLEIPEVGMIALKSAVKVGLEFGDPSWWRFDVSLDGGHVVSIKPRHLSRQEFIVAWNDYLNGDEDQ